MSNTALNYVAWDYVQFVPFAGCVAVTGKFAGDACVFPFKYGDKTFTGCTVLDTVDGRPWCSTETNVTDHHQSGKWGACSCGCPIDKEWNACCEAS